MNVLLLFPPKKKKINENFPAEILYRNFRHLRMEKNHDERKCANQANHLQSKLVVDPVALTLSKKILVQINVTLIKWVRMFTSFSKKEIN